MSCQCMVANAVVTEGAWALAAIVVTDFSQKHYCEVKMGAMASQITSPTIVYSSVLSGADQI